MKTYDVPGIEAYEIALTVEARLENGQAFRLEALKIEKPHDFYYTVRCYTRQGLATTLPEVRMSKPEEAVRTALCHLAAQTK